MIEICQKEDIHMQSAYDRVSWDSNARVTVGVVWYDDHGRGRHEAVTHCQTMNRDIRSSEYAAHVAPR
jgi:hypothetical protein